MRYDYRYGVPEVLMAIAFSLGGCSARMDESSIQQGEETEISFDTHPTKESLVVSAPGLGGCDLYLVDLPTLQVQRLTRTNELDEVTPRFSPDGKAVVYAARRREQGDKASWHLFTVDLDTQKWAQLTSDPKVADFEPRFSPDGKFILFHRSSRLRQSSFGGYGWYGSAVYLLEVQTRRISPTWATRIESYNFSPDGMLALSYALSGSGASAKLDYGVFHWSALGKGFTEAIAEADTQLTPFIRSHSAGLLWSPQKSCIIYTALDPQGSRYLGEIWMADPTGNPTKQLTHLQKVISDLRFSSDGKRIYFLLGMPGNQALWCVEIETGKSKEVLPPRFFKELAQR